MVCWGLAWDSALNEEKEMKKIESAIECRSYTASFLRIGIWKKDYFPASGSNPIFAPRGRTLLHSYVPTLLNLDFLILETTFDFGRWKYKLQNHNFCLVPREGMLEGREGKMPIEDSLQLVMLDSLFVA